MEDIDVAGTLCNMMEDGFTIKDAFSEKIDNSFDWGATQVVCKFDTTTRKCLFIDNGVGMGTEKLKKAIRLNSRSPASNSKQGKYGAGLPHALVVDTQLKGKISIISKELSSPIPLSVSIDFPECVKYGSYSNKPGEITVSQNEIYLQNRIGEHGTIIVEDFAEKTLSELVAGINSNEIVNSLVYELGVKYADYINDGKELKIIVDDYEIQIPAIDPLCLDSLCLDRQTVECSVYSRGSEIRVSLYENGHCGYYEIGKNNKVKGKLKKYTNYDVDNWIFIANLTVKSGYSPSKWMEWATSEWNNEHPSWDNLQKPIIDFIENGEEEEEEEEEEDDDVDTKNKHRNQGRSKFMGGTYYKRNQKCIGRTDINRPTNGYEDEKEFVVDSRHQVQFSIELDNLFDVQINKSRIHEENICLEVRATIQKIEKDFAFKMYKKHRANKYKERCKQQKKNPVVEDPVIEINDPVIEDPVIEINNSVANDPVVEINDQVANDPVVVEINDQVANDPVVVEINDQVANDQVVIEINDPVANDQVVIEINDPVANDQVVIEINDPVANDQVLEDLVANNPVVEDPVIEEEKITANIRNVSSFQHTTISVRDGYQLIERASEETIDTVLLMYFDRCARDQVQIIMNVFVRGINDKKKLLRIMVENRYFENLEVDMLGGAELVRNTV